MNIKYKCIVCQQKKDILVDLVMSGFAICNECGEWLATLSRDNEEE